MAKTALSRFFHQINKSNWEVFQDKGYTRIAYIGTSVSNLAKLVDEVGFDASSLHFPFPSVRPTMPWKPSPAMPLIQWYSNSFVDDLSALPIHKVRDELVESFFSKIHPGFPIVDESEFRRQYRSLDNPPPLLLFQAVLLAGAHVSEHPNIFPRRSQVKKVIYRRAKALFDLHYENDRMHVVQAALLFMFYLEGADDICSNVYYWAGVACRVAFGLGMHRDLATALPILMPKQDRRIYRRIWWTLFQVEVLSSLHHGRPSMIDLDEIDQTPLQTDDFVEQNGQVNGKVDIDYCIQNTQLCHIMISIIKLSSPGAVRRYATSPESFQVSQESVDRKLVSWYLNLPTALAEPIEKSNTKRFWALQLQLHYNLALLHLHRLPEELFPHADPVQKLNSNVTCQAAATAISKLFDDIIAANAISMCWFTALTSLFATALQISHEARTAARNRAAILAIQAQTRLRQVLPAISAVSPYWPSAEAILHVYNDLLVQFQKQSQATSNVQYDLHSGLSSRRDELTITQASDHNAMLVENNDSLGIVGVSGTDWQALFGAGSPHRFPELDFEGVDEWLYPS
ncbi:uncharacterized protein A1O9_03513 [Exophiala aquamarina CBS 119918]|uniref:Xylanolytic transcriptional activator regulatory domain-containing protein n=1 Tax=Exophiala aquamarina CBS 119918 TaxID=1182545 RepID=A0A072PPY0_9EURO|nr:uncharacterized protein A1O9_03513 [Exophiala aquamarina CBS 119918]KEF61941.1 hypothetical protein A1O9_03513 [Exophiala aquamarina CBS 119918]